MVSPKGANCEKPEKHYFTRSHVKIEGNICEKRPRQWESTNQGNKSPSDELIRGKKRRIAKLDGNARNTEKHSPNSKHRLRSSKISESVMIEKVNVVSPFVKLSPLKMNAPASPTRIMPSRNKTLSEIEEPMKKPKGKKILNPAVKVSSVKVNISPPATRSDPPMKQPLSTRNKTVTDVETPVKKSTEGKIMNPVVQLSPVKIYKPSSPTNNKSPMKKHMQEGILNPVVELSPLKIEEPASPIRNKSPKTKQLSSGNKTLVEKLPAMSGKSSVQSSFFTKSETPVKKLSLPRNELPVKRLSSSWIVSPLDTVTPTRKGSCMKKPSSTKYKTTAKKQLSRRNKLRVSNISSIENETPISKWTSPRIKRPVKRLSLDESPFRKFSPSKNKSPITTVPKKKNKRPVNKLLPLKKIELMKKKKNIEASVKTMSPLLKKSRTSPKKSEASVDTLSSTLKKSKISPKKIEASVETVSPTMKKSQSPTVNSTELKVPENPNQEESVVSYCSERKVNLQTSSSPGKENIDTQNEISIKETSKTSKKKERKPKATKQKFYGESSKKATCEPSPGSSPGNTKKIPTKKSDDPKSLLNRSLSFEKYGIVIPSVSEMLEQREKFDKDKDKLDKLLSECDLDLTIASDPPDTKDEEEEEELIPILGCEHMDSNQLREAFNKNLDYLKKIMNSEIVSVRHNKYQSNLIQYDVLNDLTYNESTIVFTPDQQLELMTYLEEALDPDGNLTRYFFQVLLPELCLKIFCDEHKMGKEEAIEYLTIRPLI